MPPKISRVEVVQYSSVHQISVASTNNMAPDARFARLQTDPRFRRPKQKHLKAEIDERFKDVLSEEFGAVKGKGRWSTAGSTDYSSC